MSIYTYRELLREVTFQFFLEISTLLGSIQQVLALKLHVQGKTQI